MSSCVPGELRDKVESWFGYLTTVLRGHQVNVSLFVELVLQATVSDQSVVEGQEVTMSVRVSGQPKPLLYW